MKILHTSDWHLGQLFFTQSRANEHQLFFKWLLDVVAQQGIDAIIVAGDIFDTGTPPSYARSLYHQLISELQSLKCTLVVLGGNHDAVSVLNESRHLMTYLNCHVIASTAIEPDEQVFVLKDKLGQPGAILCAIPFIRPRDVLKSQGGEQATDKRYALSNAIKQHYATRYTQACELRDTLGQPVPIIATGHLTALGVKTSDSVRDIYIGNLEGFAADGFPPADYIALGHIHRPQIVAKQPHIRYSGSPFPLSFDELKSEKQVMVVTTDNSKVTQITPIPIPCFQPMAVLRGNLDDIERELSIHPLVTQASFDLPVWLCIEVETQDYLTDLQQRVQALTQDKPVEVLQLKRLKTNQRDNLAQLENETLAELSAIDVFSARLAQEHFESPDELAQKQRIEALFKVILEDVEHQSANTHEDVGGSQ